MSQKKPFKKKSLLKLKNHKTFDQKVDRACTVVLITLVVTFILNMFIACQMDANITIDQTPQHNVRGR